MPNRCSPFPIRWLTLSKVEGLFTIRHKSSGASGLAYILILLSSLAWAVTPHGAQETKKTFTVADEIGLTLFGTPKGGPPDVRFSPNGNYFVVWTERGRLDLNCPEDSLRFYRSQDIRKFLESSYESQPPSPVWVVKRCTENEGPIITHWRWLSDSGGVAFLERVAGGGQRLVLADLRRKTVEPLTSRTDTIKSFDIRDRQHYVYTVTDPGGWAKLDAERRGPETVGTDRTLYELLLPENPLARMTSSSSSYRNLNLWAVIDGESFKVKSASALLPLIGETLCLSPDGHSLVTELPVADVPQSWETLYPSSYPRSSGLSKFRILGGHQDPQSSSVHQYVRITLQTGSVQALTDAPTSAAAGFWTSGSPSWSNDGQAIVLPGTFLRSKDKAPSRPCVALVDLSSNSTTCIEVLKGHTDTGPEEGYHAISGVRFVGGDERRVLISFSNPDTHSSGAIEYRHNAAGRWEIAWESTGLHEVRDDGLDLTVKQRYDQPPLLVATRKQTSRIVWDPNPQLKDIELSETSIYTWKDKDGRDWRGELFMPSNYKAGRHYPLVIQGHGFNEFEFRPSGVFPTAFAARALAAAGIAVLQVKDSDGMCPVVTIDEGACAVAGYESGATHLISDGLADPERIGLIGFSRTCFYVMQTLTTGSLQLKAASITDGFMVSYVQYLQRFGIGDSSQESDVMIGAQPFGQGLQLWLNRSPTFNLDKVNTPLMVVGDGPVNLLFMWEPYAGLRYLHKPVDLIMLNTNEHVLTNPAVRMSSQGGSVDWFRFWLKDEEDSDPRKTYQYVRWRELRKLQEANGKKN